MSLFATKTSCLETGFSSCLQAIKKNKKKIRAIRACFIILIDLCNKIAANYISTLKYFTNGSPYFASLTYTHQTYPFEKNNFYTGCLVVRLRC